MKFSPICVLAAMFLVGAVAIAGCSSTGPSAPAAGGTPTATTAGGSPSGASTTPVAGSVVTGESIFGAGASYNWIEYKMTMEGMTAFMKFEKSGKCTMRMESADLPGGSMTIDCSPTGQVTGQAQENPAEVRSDVKFIFVGIEPVSVPAGTYLTASKYSVTSDGNTIYYWTAPGVPTFVKYEVTTDDGKAMTELNGWG
jgi:hypothetical protein